MIEVKEAIEKVKDKYEGWMGYAMSQKIFNELEEERDKVISLLQQGEAYRQSHIELIEEIEKRQAIINELSKYKDMWYDNKSYSKSKKIDELEQKYFPKEIIEEVVEGITEQIEEGAEIARKEANK